MKVSDLGEFGLISRLGEIIARTQASDWEASRQITVGLGDDAAVWRASSPFQIATVDSLVQDVHFTLDTITWRELGWKSLAVNLSDIAAMGGVPLYALINIGLPTETSVEHVTELYEGVLELAGKHQVVIAGGDTVTSPFVFVCVTVIGRPSSKEGRVLTRSASRPGDLIGVTNTLGGSTAGLRMLLDKLDLPESHRTELRRAHLTPEPRLKEGRTLVELGVRAGMDISDGLAGDLTHICEMSRVSARLNVDLVPVNASTRACFGERALEFALGGGEDYELLFTAPAEIMENVKKTLACPVTIVGEILAESRKPAVSLSDSKGRPVHIEKQGWDHFSGNSKVISQKSKR